MSYVSPRSLKLLEDIVNASDNIADYVDLASDPMSEPTSDPMSGVDNGRRAGDMNAGDVQDFDDTLNFFEKLQRENDPVANGHCISDNNVSNYNDNCVTNGEAEENLTGIPEESEDETSYTVSESTFDRAVHRDIFTEPASDHVPRKRRSRKLANNRKYNSDRKYRPAKTSSVREGSTDRDSSLGEQAETMSDSGHVGRRQRKLHKRAQMRAFRPIGLEPLETAEDRLERKYEELERLMAGQFIHKKTALCENHAQQMELLRQQYAIASHGLPPTGMSSHHRQGAGNKENHHHPIDEDEAYGTIRTLQATKLGQRRSRSRGSRARPFSAARKNHSRSTSREEREGTPEQNKNISDNQNDKLDKKEGKSVSRSRSRSSSGSPKRLLIPTDSQLKNTENEFIQEWLKQKDIDLRKRKTAERKKKKLERKEKIEKQILKEEKYKDSKMIVQYWMKKKRKEAFQKQRYERDTRHEDAAQAAHERAKRVSGVHGLGVDRPQSASSQMRVEVRQKVSRPGTTAEELQEFRPRGPRDAEEENRAHVDHEVPKPPVTNYVYRRPVLGKVRLRMKQPEAAERSKSPSARRPAEKTLSREEQEKKQRVSYDAWLQQKRKEDVEKRKEMQKEQEHAKSHPDFARPFPGLDQDGEGNMVRGVGLATPPTSNRSPYKGKVIGPEEQERIRRRVRREKERFVGSVEDEVDTQYDTRSESPEEAIQRVARGVVSYVLRSLSDNDDEEEEEEEVLEDDDEAEHEGLANLAVCGSKTNLRNRPMSASGITVPSPQASKSPRRPVSAQPKTKPPSGESTRGKLPFPPDLGTPTHLKNVQEKIFPDRMWMNPVDSGQRPEPQGSDSTEGKRRGESFPRGRDDTDGGQDDPKSAHSVAHGNDNLSPGARKHVSFSEETTIFEDGSEVEEDVEWEDGNQIQDGDDLEQARHLFLRSDGMIPDNSAPSDNFFITNSVEGQ